MKELSINGAASGTYLIDLGGAGDRAIWERILLDDRRPGNSHRLTLQAGNLLVYDLRNGRGVGSKDNPHILFQPMMEPAAWAGLCGTAGDPVGCPFCAGIEVRYVNSISTVVTSNEMDPTDKTDGLDLDEWQCRGTCNGRSFWI